jgi:hypothetical protein
MSARTTASILLWLAASTPLASCAGGARSEAPKTDHETRWRQLSAKIDAPTLRERFLQASALFLGTAYHDGPLGEGDAGGPDPEPRVDFDRADCVTYLEQSLALALGSPSGDEPGFRRVLDRIRYRDGRVEFAARNHYMSIDWTAANTWLVEDVTARIAPGAAVEIVRTIDRAQFLREKGATPREGVDDARAVTLVIVPRESLAAVSDSIRAGDLVFWAGKRDGIDFVHTGLAARDAQGALLFRHASSKAGQVVEESFAGYASRAAFSPGFALLRLRDDAALALAAPAPAGTMH